MSSIALRLVGPLVLGLGLVLGCSEREPSTDAALAGPASHPVACPQLALRGVGTPRSVIFVLADTLRRDRPGAYGGAARTPAFDRLADEGVRFTEVSSQAPWTKPSIATLFTGLYPSQHGVVSHPRLRKGEASHESLASDVLAAGHVTLAEALSAAGWRTAGFVSNPWLQQRLGFAQGFDLWDDSFAANETPGDVVTRAGLDWLRALPDDDRRFFLYLHYMDAHAPYHPIPDAALAERRAAIESDRRPVMQAARTAIARRARDERGVLVATRGIPANLALMELVYDQGVEAFDRALGDLLEALDGIPAARDAAVVLTSDHGEALYQRGWGSHGYGLFDDEIGVPLLVRWPGVGADGPVDCPLGLVDLRSTLCDLLGVPCGPDQGRSLLAGDAVAPSERIVLSEGVIERPRHRAARDLRYALLYEPDGRTPLGARPVRHAWSLFDHATDPEEWDDLLADEGVESETAADAESRLRVAVESGIAELELAEPEVAPLDDETRRRLEALGYGGDAGGGS